MLLVLIKTDTDDFSKQWRPESDEIWVVNEMEQNCNWRDSETVSVNTEENDTFFCTAVD